MLKYCNFEEYSICIFLWSPMVLPGEPFVLHCTPMLLNGKFNKMQCYNQKIWIVSPSTHYKAYRFYMLKYCNFEEYSICIFLWSPMFLLGEPLVLLCTPMLLIERTNKSHEVVSSNCKGGSLAPQCGYLRLHV